MKKLTLLLFVAVLLAACQPAATPTSAPTPASVEALANSTSDLVGIWVFTGAGKLEFKADGTFTVYTGSELLDGGNYTFDAGNVTYVTSSGCINKPATYQAYVTKQDGKPVSIRLKVVGSDPCSDRANFSTTGIGRFQNP
jgi:hypothetical protein